MFKMFIKFLKTYTVWGQYIQEKSYAAFYTIFILLTFTIILVNLFLYV